MSSELIRFYRGERNKNNVTIDEVWGFSDKDLENTHNYIQWLFPIVEPDYWNRDTPKLSEDDILQFKENKPLKTKVIKSLIILSRFWGFNWGWDTDGKLKLKKGYSYEEKSKNWQTHMNHNFLRMTRVIHCLNDLGLYDIAEAFYNGIMQIALENPEKINATSIVYWRNAMVKNMKGEEY